MNDFYPLIFFREKLYQRCVTESFIRLYERQFAIIIVADICS